MTSAYPNEGPILSKWINKNDCFVEIYAPFLLDVSQHWFKTQVDVSVILHCVDK